MDVLFGLFWNVYVLWDLFLREIEYEGIFYVL